MSHRLCRKPHANQTIFSHRFCSFALESFTENYIRLNLFSNKDSLIISFLVSPFIIFFNSTMETEAHDNL